MITYTAYATADAPNWWPNKPQQAALDYALDVSAVIDPIADVISSITLAVAPSGDGEVVPSNLTFDGTLITVTMTGGQPSRIYTSKILATMQDGRVFEFLVYQGIPPGLRGFPVPVSPVPGFGTPINSTP